MPYGHVNYLCTYDLYGNVRNVFDAGRYITWASGKGFGPENEEFFGPCEMASRFPGPNSLPLAHVMYLHASKTLRTGTYKS